MEKRIHYFKQQLDHVRKKEHLIFKERVFIIIIKIYGTVRDVYRYVA